MSRTFIVAELSANHGHSLHTALETVRAARDAGADAIKVQTYTPDTITIDCSNKYFQIKQGTIWDGTTLYNLYKDAYTPWEWHEPIKKESERLGLVFFSTPFDISAVDFLEDLNVPFYKIASFEINDVPLIEYVASKGKRVIISTGIATLAEIEEAVNACRRVGNDDIVLLKCTSAYPAPVEEANLLTLSNMKEAFGVKVGLSDHTLGQAVALAAVALGAEIVEKHLILNRSIESPDVSFSMEPEEFRSMADGIRLVEKALGRITYEVSSESKKSRVFTRSLFVVRDVAAGDLLKESNVRSIRPGYGLHPRHLNEVLGKRAARTLKKGTPLSWGDIDLK